MNRQLVFSINKSLFSFCVYLIILSSCNAIDKNERIEKKTEAILIPEKKSNSEISNSLSLNITDSISNISLNDEQLFGKFFNDRIEFYIIDKLNISIHKSPVNTMTLYYIDGYLCKKKYELSSDISSALILEYGRFKVKPLNQQTKDFVKFHPELILHKKTLTLSDSLKCYQISWESRQKTTTYAVEKNTTDSLFTYIEEFPKYSALRKAVEYGVL